MSVEIIVAVIGSVSILSVALIKKFYSPNSGSQNIIDKTNTQKDVEHLKYRLDSVEKDIEKLYDADMVQHAERDKIMGIISEIKLMVAKL